MPVDDESQREWIERARMTYEIASKVEMDGDVPTRIGLDLTLRAYRPDECPGDPTCAACDRTLERLLILARAAVPEGALHQAEPDDHSFHLRPETGFASELQVTVAVFYGPKTFEQAGAEDAALVPQVTRSLEAMGVQPRVFRR